ncbi:MAG TPA: VWA domain-containing protein, partial [Blastocatellia bacterium]|nr:VWA domain-containing protein [Blastocatellia bacterium]
MAFLNPIFLLGAMAAALPVLVHLVRRTRASKIQYPSLMFLRRIEQKTIRKRKLRNLALLAMRCAALLLLALAFARPYFTGQNPMASTAERPASVILLDVSYSMRYGDVFERARQAARNVLENTAQDEQVALVAFSRNYEILRPLKADRAEVAALLDQAQPGYDATDYLQAIAAADAILKEAGQGSRKIHLISDFQASGWNRAAPPVKLSSGVRLLPVDVADAAPQNVAVTEVKAEPVIYAQKYAGKVAARVSNFGAQSLGDAAVEFKLNDLTVERRPLKLEAGAAEVVEFSGFNVPEGSNRATVEITGDNFNLDNRYFFTIRRADQARVLAIETAVRGRSESFFLQQALLAGENNQHALTLKTAGTANPAEMDSFKAVIVNDVSEVSDALAAAITDYVERGGNLILAAGKHTEPGRFNRAFGGIAPAEIGETVQARSYALMSQVKTDHPIFTAFARGGRLTSTRVYAYHRAAPKEDAAVIAALDDSSPVILERAAGKGKVLLV